MSGRVLGRPSLLAAAHAGGEGVRQRFARKTATCGKMACARISPLLHHTYSRNSSAAYPTVTAFPS